jgi:hypothetical protein
MQIHFNITVAGTGKYPEAAWHDMSEAIAVDGLGPYMGNLTGDVCVSSYSDDDVIVHSGDCDYVCDEEGTVYCAVEWLYSEENVHSEGRILPEMPVFYTNFDLEEHRKAYGLDEIQSEYDVLDLGGVMGSHQGPCHFKPDPDFRKAQGVG